MHWKPGVEISLSDPLSTQNVALQLVNNIKKNLGISHEPSMSLTLRQLTSQRKQTSRRHQNKSMPLFLLLNYPYCKRKTSSASNKTINFF